MNRLAARNNEDGAALLIALIFITVVAAVMAALLSFGDTSIRTTVALREQGTDAYTADGAAKVAINTLRNSTVTYDSKSCFDSGDSLDLPAFPSEASQSAVVTCTLQREAAPPPSAPGALNKDNTPANAILTLGTDASPTGTDPGYPAPTAAPTLQSVPTCTEDGGLVTFEPGLYTSPTALSACDRSNITMWFKPGTYYFNFPNDPDGAAVWQLNNATLVGGTPTRSLAEQVPDMPGSCVSPLTTTIPNTGVQFVFGGASRIVLGVNAHVELCGSYSPDVPPIAIYGLSSPLDAAPAQSGCVTAVDGCALISSTSDPQATNSLFVQGTLYAPNAWLDLSAIGQTTQHTDMLFTDGVIVGRLTAPAEGVTKSVISLPELSDVPPADRLPLSVALLEVFVCPDVSPCVAASGETSSGRLLLRAKVAISNPAQGAVEAGPRSVTIYSWATQR